MEYELSVHSNMQNLTAISEFITSAVSQLGLDEDQAFIVQMAVDEAVTNVIEHAYGGRSDGDILIRCWLVDDELVITILDHGEPFDPTCVLPPDVTAPLEEQEQRCLGLFLMGKLMDSVDFRFDAVAGNLLTMKKRMRSAKPALCV